MICEHFGSENKNMTYDSEYGVFVNKKGFLGLSSENIYERDISIKKNNELRKLSGNTVLSDSDIDLLYEFAKMEFGFKSVEQEKKYLQSQVDC